jgi:hypothetical protein
MKFPRPIRHHQRNSKRTPSWPWSPRQWPHICFSNTTTEVKETPEQKISPHGESHFSKRRSESKNESKSDGSESKSDGRKPNKDKPNKAKDINKMSKSKSKSESKSDCRKPNKDKTNKVKAIEELKIESRTELKGRQDKAREVQMLTDSILKFSFHLHLAATFTISSLFSNSVLSDHVDHNFMYPFQTFTLKDFRGCERHSSL